MASIDDEALQFEAQMNKLMKLYLRFNRQVEVKLARTAEEHFKENFEKGGFVNGGTQTWDPRSPDLDPGRAVLVDSGELKNSIEGSVPQPGKIIVKTDLVYAKAHNEGVPERNLPQRQFIGMSKELNDKIKKLIIKEFKTSVKNKLR
jgi:phage gpG-like protein